MNYKCIINLNPNTNTAALTVHVLTHSLSTFACPGLVRKAGAGTAPSLSRRAGALAALRCSQPTNWRRRGWRVEICTVKHC